MTWLLHLSDLHLAAGGGRELDDAKIDIEPRSSRLTDRKVLQWTLGAVRGIVNEQGRPTVAAISGDLTTACADDGFEAFRRLLEDYADVLPENPQNVVVVPGNHDVDWERGPGTRERYDGFHAATRDRGLTTPLIDDLDFEETSAAVELRSHVLERPPLVITDDLLVVAINSSNWCGVVTSDPKHWSEGRWRDALDALGETAQDEALTELRRMRQYDIGRVSRQQLDAIGKALDRHGIPHDPREDPDRLRIAVIHHQLLPVSRKEEVKAFESVVNLGFVRESLRELGIGVVLHGHKHESGLQWDVGGLAGARLDTQERRMLLVASPGNFDRDGAAMRAIELRGDRLARSLRIRTLLGVDRERKAPKEEAAVEVPLWRAEMQIDADAGEVIQGPSAHAVYSRLSARLAGTEGRPVHNLICMIESSDGATALPESYPEMDGEIDGQAWFEGLVRWWQLPSSELVRDGTLPFNHGDRIHTRFGDQIGRAAELLASKQDTTRGIIQLFSPTEKRSPEDDVAHGLIPAFSHVQPVLRDAEGGNRRLDCTGYFRKQEMRFWWPINVAELAAVQTGLMGRLRAMGLPVAAGRLVTISAVAHYGSQLPRMAVPEIDLAVEAPDRLWRMAAAICFPAGSGAVDGLADWDRVLDDLRGRLDDGSLRVAKAGPQRLLDHIRTLHEFADGDTARARVESALDDLVATYGGHAQRMSGREAARAIKVIEELAAAVEALKAS